MFTRKKFITFLRHPSPSPFPPPPLSLSFSIISQFSMVRSKTKTAVNRMDGLESLDPCVLRFSTHTAPIIILEGGKRNEKNKPAHDTHDTHDVFFSSAHRRLTSLSLPTLPHYLAQAATVSLPAEVRMQAVKVVPAACIITLL